MLGPWRRKYLPTNPLVWIPFVGYFLLVLDSPPHLRRRSIINGILVSAVFWGLVLFALVLPSGYFPASWAEELYLLTFAIMALVFYPIAAIWEPKHVIANRKNYSTEKASITGWNLLMDLTDSQIKWEFRAVNYHEFIFFMAGLAVLFLHIT